LFALAHLRTQSVGLALGRDRDKFDSLRFEQQNSPVNRFNFLCHNTIFTHELRPDGHMPKSDLANAVTKPDDTGPKVVLQAKLIDGHGKISEAD